MDIFMSKRLTSNNKWMHRLSRVSGPNKTPPAGHESQSESWLRPWSFVVGRDCKERQMFYGKANWEEWKSFQQTPQINQASINHFLKLPFIDWTEEELAFTAQFLFLGGGRLVYRHLLLTPCFLVNNSSQPGAFFVFHLHEWEAFLRNQGTTKLNTGKIPKPFSFSEFIYFSSTLQTTCFTQFSGRWTIFFIFQLSIKVTILWNIKHLWRDSLHL